MGTSFLDHTKELLYRLRTIVASIVIASVAVMLVPVSLDFSAGNLFYATITSSVIRDLQARYLPVGAELLPLSFLAPLEVYVFVSIILGVVISFPVISYELYKFINPALYKHEKRVILQYLASFIGQFIFGFLLGYFFVVPATMNMLFMFPSLLDLPPVYDFASFFSLIGFTLLSCGLIFTLPTYIVLLVKVGILKTKSLTKNRKYMYGILIILIAIIDPEPGLITEAFIFIPLVILIEISIAIAKRIEKNRDAADTEET